MKDHYYQLFQKLKNEAPSALLYQRIAREIARLEHQVVLVRRFFVTMITALFLVTFIPAFNYLMARFAESSFGSYSSLLLSDGDLALLHSKEFILSLVESLPISSITLALALIFLFLAAIRLIGTQTRQAVELLSGRFA